MRDATNDYLSQIIKYDRIIENKQDEIIRFRNLLASMTAKLKDENVQLTVDKDKMSAYMSQIVDDEREIEQLLTQRRIIIGQIEDFSMDPRLYQVLYCRYVDGTTISEACSRIKCSRTKAHELHHQALDDFEKVYGHLYMKNRRKRKKVDTTEKD